MSFKDLEEFFDSSLRLPIGGKTYVIPPPDGETGLWCQRIFNVAVAAQAGKQLDDATAAKLQLDDDEERDLFERLIGKPLKDDELPSWYTSDNTLTELLDDGVDWPRIQHVGKTAFFWAAVGIEQAETYWNTAGGGSPEAPAPKQPQDRQRPSASKKKSAPRGSRGGSTSRPATVKGEVVATPGGSSSSAGH